MLLLSNYQDKNNLLYVYDIFIIHPKKLILSYGIKYMKPPASLDKRG